MTPSSGRPSGVNAHAQNRAAPSTTAAVARSIVAREVYRLAARGPHGDIDAVGR